MTHIYNLMIQIGMCRLFNYTILLQTSGSQFLPSFERTSQCQELIIHSSQHLVSDTSRPSTESWEQGDRWNRIPAFQELTDQPG
jgi:hypothetical protein